MSKKVLKKKELIDIMNLCFSILSMLFEKKKSIKEGGKSENSKENINNYNYDNFMQYFICKWSNINKFLC